MARRTFTDVVTDVRDGQELSRGAVGEVALLLLSLQTREGGAEVIGRPSRNARLGKYAPGDAAGHSARSEVQTVHILYSIQCTGYVLAACENSLHHLHSRKWSLLKVKRRTSTVRDITHRHYL